MNLQHFVESLPLQLNVTERSNCPECGNYNTFAVTKKVDGTYWFCFHNSCRAKGKANGTIDTGRHIDLGEEVPLNNLFLSMLDRMDAGVTSIGDSSGRLTELQA